VPDVCHDTVKGAVTPVNVTDNTPSLWQGTVVSTNVVCALDATASTIKRSNGSNFFIFMFLANKMVQYFAVTSFNIIRTYPLQNAV
jgi:hypothetical protein